MQIAHRIQSATAKLGLNLLSLSGFYRGYWQHWRGQIFDYAETLGLHVLPVHYYSPVPTRVDLARKQRFNDMPGIELNVPGGAAKANDLLSKYADRLRPILEGHDKYNPTNAGFAPLDAAILYALVSEIKPKRIIEIGSGMSTFAIAAAIRDASPATYFTCIEPFLPDYLKGDQQNVSEVIELPLQEVPIARFEALEAGDILFIDSTHVVRYDSDVVYEFLHILPILKPGVIVHVHDIFFPDDYPEAWLKQYRFFWNEQYLLQAFLSMNGNYKIDLPVHAVKDMIHSDLPFTTTVEPASLWMRRV